VQLVFLKVIIFITTGYSIGNQRLEFVTLQVLAEQLNCSVEEIVDFELNVCDTQPSCLGGARKEFIFSGRLDNLASSYCALRALLDTCSDSASLADESCIRAIALFDNEEVIFTFIIIFISSIVFSDF